MTLINIMLYVAEYMFEDGLMETPKTGFLAAKLISFYNYDHFSGLNGTKTMHQPSIVAQMKEKKNVIFEAQANS